MDLQAGYYYHIYNRGNNSQNIFFNRDNYLFFLRKMKQHLAPFVSVMAWCLMPNHFHWVVFVHRNNILKEESGLPTSSSGDHSTTQTLNQSIGILLSSYTRALQKQEKFTGSLFQKRTKVKPLEDEIKIEPAYWNTFFGTQIYHPEGKSYLETCVEYVHQNPVHSRLVENIEDWEFSSFRDYLGYREGKLVDYELVKEEGLLPAESHHPNRSRETTTIVIISIGSNIEAEKNIQKMLGILETKVEVLKVSTMITTKPIGIENQADFTNGAVKIQTRLNQTELNQLLKDIENQLGRDRTAPKFGPRCIDLDVVVWNRKIVDEDYYTREFLQKSVKELGGVSSSNSR